MYFITGMSWRDFKGMPSLQEVECWGGYLAPEVKLLSLEMLDLRDNTVLSLLNVLTGSCMTFGQLSSCVLDEDDPRMSRLRVLAYDLDEGDSREYGCTVHVLNSFGKPETSNWNIVVKRNSEY